MSADVEAGCFILYLKKWDIMVLPDYQLVLVCHQIKAM